MGERVRVPAKWKIVKRLPANAVPITPMQMRGGCTVEQGFQSGRSRYIATKYWDALNWFRVERSSRRYPLVTTPEAPVHD